MAMAHAEYLRVEEGYADFMKALLLGLWLLLPRWVAA